MSAIRCRLSPNARRPASGPDVPRPLPPDGRRRHPRRRDLVTVRLGRTAHVVAAGESFTVPAGASHTFVNHTGAEAHFMATFTPALRLEAYFTALFELGGRPGRVDLARLMAEYPDEHFYLAAVPVRVQ